MAICQVAIPSFRNLINYIISRVEAEQLIHEPVTLSEGYEPK